MKHRYCGIMEKLFLYIKLKLIKYKSNIDILDSLKDKTYINIVNTINNIINIDI